MVPAQLNLTITEFQINLITKVVEAAAIPLCTWWYKCISRRTNKFLKDTTGAIESNLIQHIDTKFQEHETSAFAKLDSMNTRLTAVEGAVDKRNMQSGTHLTINAAGS